MLYFSGSADDLRSVRSIDYNKPVYLLMSGGGTRENEEDDDFSEFRTHHACRSISVLSLCSTFIVKITAYGELL